MSISDKLGFLYSLENHIIESTRETSHSRTLLDPVLISDTLSSISSEVISVPREISDTKLNVLANIFLFSMIA